MFFFVSLFKMYQTKHVLFIFGIFFVYLTKASSSMTSFLTGKQKYNQWIFLWY